MPNKNFWFTLALFLFFFANTVIRPQSPANFEKSLHYTRAGAEYWYCEENGGFETITKMKISPDCMNCHAEENALGSRIIHDKYTPSCSDCHDTPNSKKVNLTACRNCHTHQTAEIGVAGDVHRDKGMVCTDCHTASDMHGDGRELRSIYEGAVEKTCETCHKEIKPSKSHSIHIDKLDCSACHMQTQVSCFNCHFETGRINSGLHGYILLAKNTLTKKIQAANFMGLTFRDKSFLAIGPYKAHTISKEGRKCGDCHASPVVMSYKKTKKIILTYWDGEKGIVINTNGVIPVPEDWKTSITADFVVYDRENVKTRGWSKLKRGIDKSQMLFLEPLPESTVKKLYQKMN